jgi:carotenoid cleavage dioxygenase-like enzyme
MASTYSLGFTTQSNEIQRESLSVTGQIPTWLSGTLIRNGPAKFEVGPQSYRHWFDGLAMLHAFAFREGQVFYSNRFLRSGAFEDASRTGKIVRGEFATNPQRSPLGWLWSLFFPKPADNACVNVTMIDGSHVALTETPFRIAFSPETLNTVGPFQYSDKLKGQVTTVHPHYDFERRELVNFVTHIARKSLYHVYRIKDGERRREIVASVPVEEPGYMHSFALTENYVILVEFPLVVRPLDLFFGRRPFIENFRWKPDRGTRFIVVDRNGRGSQGTYRAEPMFAFHHINAHEQDDQLVLDVAAYEDKDIIDSLYLDRLRDEAGTVPMAKLARYRIPLGGSSVSREPMMDLAVELPRINYRACNMRRHRFVYGVGRTGLAKGMYNGLVKADLETGESQQWSEERCFPGEPVLVTRMIAP